MNNFVYQNATRIVFGKGTEEEVGALVKERAGKALLVYGGGSIHRTGLHARVLRSLAAAGVTVRELGGVQPNPRLGLVRKGIELCRTEQIPFLLAVGGGSSIDTAKAIAAGVPCSGDVWQLFEGAPVREALPVGAVLTIPAAGSENSIGAVITREEGKYKRAIVSELLRPVFAILDPELTYTLDARQTATGIANIMAHLVERYFTRVGDVDLTDRLIEATMRSLVHNAYRVLAEPQSYAARAEIMWAGTVAHNDSVSMGRIGDWGSHNIEHELSASYDVPHGAGLAVVMPAWMRYVHRHDVPRFAQFAARVWEVEPDWLHPEKTALEGIRRFQRFLQEIGLPVSLKELAIPDGDLTELARKCTEKGPTGEFVKLHQADVLAIYELAR